MKDFLKNLRDDHRDFDEGKLDGHFDSAPWALFSSWYEAAFENEKEPNAMTVATVSPEGQPKVRIVYLKECTDEKFVFYTNYLSEKGIDLLKNPMVSLLFFWPLLQRQIRIDGVAQKTAVKISDAYFASRPRTSQLGAWASRQSEELEHRKDLEERLIELDAKFPNEVLRPPHWGGYDIVPHRIEFWQGRPSRLHDRIVYERKENKAWRLFRLNP